MWKVEASFRMKQNKFNVDGGKHLVCNKKISLLERVDKDQHNIVLLTNESNINLFANQNTKTHENQNIYIL